ncbi:MAG: hypothetical protein A2Y63_01305 [Candidatus Riflebacteria bacterium RBG_13_59_9]|nr:MAG: hypothetical protein A2Y63_01305 [Candidatus Riflebacteria bacterium RBG_13_59_9]
MSTLVDYTYPLETLLKHIRRAGFEAVAFGHKTTHFPYYERERVVEVAELCTKLGLFVDYIHTPIDLFLDLSAENEHARQATLDTCKLTIDAVQEMGGRAITVHLCNKERMTESEIETRVPIALASIKELGDYAAEREVFFCLENLPYRFSYHRILEAVFEAYEGNNVYLCLDTCHISMGNPDSFKFIEKYLHLIKTVHLSDNYGDRDLHLTPYAGTFDFDRLARMLGESSYDGNVMLENSREAATKRFLTGQNSPREPHILELDDYLMKSYLAAKRFQLTILEARQVKLKTG